MSLNSIFKSHMVFAVGKPIRIYGEGSGNIEISFASYTKQIEPIDGKWFVEFPPMEYGGPYQIIAVSENESVIIEDIYIGDVYLFAGQSNMQFKLHESSAPSSVYKSNEKLRLFSTDRLEAGEYYTSVDGWVKSEKDTVGNWSAIAYLSGSEIVTRKDIAVGIITCYQGASIIESWVPKGTFEKANINLPLEKKHIDHVHAEFQNWNVDGKLYTHVLSQAIPYSINAVVWYQGESDTSVAEGQVYALELAELIKVWRNDFMDMELPFVIIQIADFVQRDDEGWKSVQKAQLDVEKLLPNVKTVISADVCENDDIHPKTKDIIAKRVVEALISFSE